MTTPRTAAVPGSTTAAEIGPDPRRAAPLPVGSSLRAAAVARPVGPQLAGPCRRLAGGLDPDAPRGVDAYE